jgi:hypothetical protein
MSSLVPLSAGCTTAGRDWTVAVRLPSTLRNFRLVANVGDVDHLLDRIRQ